MVVRIGSNLPSTMQCEIRGMVEMDEARRTSSDTLPKPGRVTEVCREWLVHEDGALAYRLQNEEIQQHYSGNKFRNAIVRQDLPKARDEQKKEEEEAAAVQAFYEKMLREQEQQDAHVAQKIAEKLEREEFEKRRAAEEKDCEIAQELQIIPNGSNTDSDLESDQCEEQEKLRLEQQKALLRQQSEDTGPQHVESPVERPPMKTLSQPCSPFYEESLCQGLRVSSLGDINPRVVTSDSSDCTTQPTETTNSLSDLSDFCLQPSPGMSEEDARRLQEEQDAELARLLQEQESKRRGDMLDRDRLLAVEAQDRELAKMLQERERAKAKRAREKARQKALLKKQQQQQNPVEGSGDVGPNQTSSASPEPDIAPYPAVRPMDLDLSGALNTRTGKFKPRGEEKNGNDWFWEVKNRNGQSGFGLETELIEGAEGSDRPEIIRRSTRIRRPPNRYPDPEAIEVLPASPEPSTSQGLPNIAMAIDPTYPRRIQTGEFRSSSIESPNSNVSSPAMSLPPPDFDEDDDNPAPPYMPIQGQRRSSSLEKKSKKGKQKKEGKDGCKQQ